MPARGGSKGVPRKNISPLAGEPLIVHTIREALSCPLVDDLVVTTDDEDIRRIALERGALAPFLRPAHLATGTALAIPTIQHAVLEMEARRDRRYDFVAMLQPTTPLRSADDITNALGVLIESGADGVISVVDVDNWHPMKMKRFDGNRLVDYDRPPVENPPRQSLPRVYMVNGAVYATRRDVLMEEDSFQGENCLGYVMPPERSVNIDSEADFVLAEYWMRKASVIP